MKKHLQKMLAAAAAHVPDGLAVAGAGAVSAGVGMIYQPAGVITAGLFLMIAAFLAVRGGKK